MKNWLSQDLVLKGRLVDLYTLQTNHLLELEAIAKNKDIWEHYIIDASQPNTFNRAFTSGLAEMGRGAQHIFVIYHREKQELVGSTRFLEINEVHKKLEIGWTWMHPDYWGSKINAECKLLLLTHAFENLEITRVQLRTEELNLRSRKAIEKLGAKFEGIVRHDFIRENGTHRNSAFYSIIDSEWSKIKSDLHKLLA